MISYRLLVDRWRLGSRGDIITNVQPRRAAVYLRRGWIEEVKGSAPTPPVAPVAPTTPAIDPTKMTVAELDAAAAAAGLKFTAGALKDDKILELSAHLSL